MRDITIRREITFGFIAIVAPLVAGLVSQLHYSGVISDRGSPAFFTSVAMLISCVALWRTLDCGFPMKALAIFGYAVISGGLAVIATLTVASWNGDSL